MLSHTPYHVYGDHWMSFLTSTILQHDSGLQNLENSIVESDREGFLSSWAWWVFFSSRRSFQQTSLNRLDFLSPGQEFSSSLQILQVSFQLFLWFFQLLLCSSLCSHLSWWTAENKTSSRILSFLQQRLLSKQNVMWKTWVLQLKWWNIHYWLLLLWLVKAQPRIVNSQIEQILLTMDAFLREVVVLVANSPYRKGRGKISWQIVEGKKTS